MILKRSILFQIPILVTYCSLCLIPLASLADHTPQKEYQQIQDKIDKFDPQNDAYMLQHQMLLEQAADHNAMIFPTDRDPVDVVIRRMGALLSRLEGEVDLSREKQSLEFLQEKSRSIALNDHQERRRLFIEAIQLRRRITFRNPLLTMDKILFIKRDPANGDEHMCDQFYGFNAHKTGGLYILENPFSDSPIVKNVLEHSVCSNGRFKGRRLENGGFLSPSLSYDGKQILFAFTEADSSQGQWTKESTFHIFKVNVDGTSLTQLTDGAWNDFDPCWMPNGRIVFTSERRGGYLRCSGARPCPNYTLHTMNQDGSDIVCISPHELHEWHPSIDNNGMIIYTRWDYIDRGDNQAHHPWIMTPDGRDPRALHGNFPIQWKPTPGHERDIRPHMELDLSAIPQSNQLAATAVSHHGQAFGSLIRINPQIEDNGAMSQLKRITPYARFSECEVGSRDHHYYATAFPLSEDFYLCVYSPDQRKGKYGVYLIDVFGNQELIYHDPAISCLNPIPLQPREQPPVVPHISAIGLPPNRPDLQNKSKDAKVGVMDVYNSLRPFPKNTKIAALRIYQIVLKTTPVHHDPQIGYGCETLARAILGAVPVEKDGSAYFNIPASKPVFFQAIDQNGLAVQSMRSETYVQPGETLTCLGCHERRHQSARPSSIKPLAFQRAPSEITPEVDGTNPFNFPRLVQPVLDKNCVSCHQQNQDKAPDLRKGDFTRDKFHWYTSYRNLMGHAFHYGMPVQEGYDLWTPTSRTTPGQFGARASKLYQMLSKGHHGVDLSQEDMHRITLWLDSNSDFYGSYEDEISQAHGEVVWYTLE